MKYSKLSTVIAFGLKYKEIEIIKRFESEFDFKIHITKEITDLYAIPNFISIVNPTLLTKEDLEGLIEDCWSQGERVILTSTIEGVKIEKGITIAEDLFYNPEKLRLYILSAYQKGKKTEKATKPYSQKLYRLLKIIRLFEKRKYLTTEELVSEFKISRRTLLRDLDLLQAAGEIIVYDKENKAYRWEES